MLLVYIHEYILNSYLVTLSRGVDNLFNEYSILKWAHSLNTIHAWSQVQIVILLLSIPMHNL